LCPLVNTCLYIINMKSTESTENKGALVNSEYKGNIVYEVYNVSTKYDDYELHYEDWQLVAITNPLGEDLLDSDEVFPAEELFEVLDKIQEVTASRGVV